MSTEGLDVKGVDRHFQRYPVNAPQQQIRDTFPSGKPGQSGISNYRVNQPTRIHSREETPFLPYVPSSNFNYQKWTGWDTSQLNSYIIPDADRNKLGLFNRFILKGENINTYSGRPNFSNLISERIDKQRRAQGIVRERERRFQVEETQKKEEERKTDERFEREVKRAESFDPFSPKF